METTINDKIIKKESFCILVVMVLLYLVMVSLLLLVLVLLILQLQVLLKQLFFLTNDIKMFCNITLIVKLI